MIPLSLGFLTNKGKILLMHRDNKPGTTSPNKWGLIGGHVEKGETFDQGLIREIKEEVNLDIKDFSLLASEILDRDGEKREYYYYHVPIPDEMVPKIKLLEEGQALEFKTIDEMEKLELTMSLTKFLEENNKLLEQILV